LNRLAESVLESLKRHLESESESKALTVLPGDFYSKLAAYSQRLKRSSGSGASEVAVRLAASQARMIDSLTGALLGLRIAKATKLGAALQLLPEERYVCSAEQKHRRRFETFVSAVSSGKPSFIEFAHMVEADRNMVVRFTKPVGELVGLDLRRYGPFERDDVASIPAASAEILVTGGDAVEVHTRDDA